MDEVQNKESSNIIQSPKTFRKYLLVVCLMSCNGVSINYPIHKLGPASRYEGANVAPCLRKVKYTCDNETNIS
jgi:hypothetical protein